MEGNILLADGEGVVVLVEMEELARGSDGVYNGGGDGVGIM